MQVRFILMNSFSTSDDTREHLQQKHAELIGEEDSELVQNKSPKVDAKTLKPAEYPDNRDQEWCVHLASQYHSQEKLLFSQIRSCKCIRDAQADRVIVQPQAGVVAPCWGFTY